MLADRRAVFVAALALASLGAAHVRAQPSTAEEEARERTQRGQALYERGHFDAALAELELAYERIGDHPRRYDILYDIALCHERSFRYDEALRYYQRYLEEGGEDAGTATRSSRS